MTTVKQAYEWVKTGHWSLRQFKEWAQPKQEPDIYPEEACDMGLEAVAYYTTSPKRKPLGLDDLKDLWNSQADHMNRWDELGIDEIVAFAQAARDIKEQQ